MKSLKTVALTIAASTVLLGSTLTPAKACEECQLKKEGTYLGQFTLLGNGTVRSWVKLNKSGRPTALGVTMSENALDGLATELPKGMMGMEYKLALPKEAKSTGFDHIGLDYNPKGHVPPGIYDIPHFDVHFYLVPQSDLVKITATGKDLAICNKVPAAGTVPEGYIIPPGTEVPRMGAHSIAADAPELHGKPFTHTFLYGYYNGRMNFVEPMVSNAFLKEKQNVTVPVKTPKVYLKSGYYPTSYSVTYDEARKEYSISIDGLTYREAPQRKPLTASTAKKPVVKQTAARTTRSAQR